MPVLNKVAGVWRGGVKAKAVRVATRIIWQARRIVGWNDPIQFTSRARFIREVASMNEDYGSLSPYVGQSGCMISVQGGSSFLPVTKIIDYGPYITFEVDGDAINFGVRRGTVCYLHVPRWG